MVALPQQLELFTEQQGEWVEIEPGEWFFFWSMPLSDQQVIDRYAYLCTEITRIRNIEIGLEKQLAQQEARRSKVAGDWYSRHSERYVDAFGHVRTKIADGRDALSIAPKTTLKVKDLERQLMGIRHQFDALIRERFDLQAWYPATLIKAGLWN